MDYLTQFNIAYEGLKIGTHFLDYRVGKDFFACFEFSPIKEGDFQVDLTLVKKERLFQLQFLIQGVLPTICDRCLDPLNLNVNGNFELFYKFESDRRAGDYIYEDIIYLAESEKYLRLAQHIYDFIILSLPIKKMHEEKDCNKQVMAILNRSKSNENHGYDPRWEALRNLKNN